MKNINQKTKIVAFFIAVVILIGIIVTLTAGFHFDLRYQKANSIQLYLGKDFKISDIKQITDEILPNEEVIIQKVEVYEDTVSILAKEITDEQKTNLINKVNEKYETELVADSIDITTIPHTRLRDIIRPYIIPFMIATFITLIYMAVRYYKIGIIKTLLSAVLIVVMAQVVLFSIMAIIRVPIGRLTIPIVLTIYLLSWTVITTNFEKKLTEKKQQAKNEK